MKAMHPRNVKRTQAYFDCNATTPVYPKAAEAAFKAMESAYGNPSSTHQTGLQAKGLLEATRRKAAAAIGAKPDQIIFNSGATEGIQTAVFSALQFWKRYPNPPSRPKILYAATEHKAVPEALHYWVKTLGLKHEIIEIPVDSHGQINFERLNAELPDAILLCTMAVNNESGVIQRLDEIEKAIIEQKSQTLWLVDCVQALGKIDLNLDPIRIDYAVFSGHKVYAPKGTGFLYCKWEDLYYPLIVGGGQEKGHRSGTQNLPGVAGLGVVLDLINERDPKGPMQPAARLFEFREQILAALSESFPKVILNTPLTYSVSTTINFSIPGFRSAELMDVFDSAGLRVSAGSACNATNPEPSHVLRAMGFPNWRSSSAIRLSFGPMTTQKDVDLACHLIKEVSTVLTQTCMLENASIDQTPLVNLDGVIQLRFNSTNTWLVINHATKTCIVIDPVEIFMDRVIQFVRCQGLEVLAILDTHNHADHQSARPSLQNILREQLALHSNETDPQGWPIKSPKMIEISLKHGIAADALALETKKNHRAVFAKLKTPGHTQDSVTYLLGIVPDGGELNVQFAFCGDLILSGGIGRSDFPFSDSEELFFSIGRVSEVIHENTLLCPSHDYNISFATTLKKELSENELLTLALKSEADDCLASFLRLKERLDRELSTGGTQVQAVFCGLSKPPLIDRQSSNSITFDELEAFLAQESPHPLYVIDVREPQEYALCRIWRKMGYSKKTENIPISRLVNFMSDLIQTQDLKPRVLLFCRTGMRSLQATLALRQLGYSSVWNIEGGIALVG